MQVGKPTDSWKEDTEGKPESGAMKAVRGVAKKGAKVTSKVAKDSGLIDEKYADIVVRTADLVDQQADADVHTSLKDRAKLGGMYDISGAHEPLVYRARPLLTGKVEVVEQMSLVFIVHNWAISPIYYILLHTCLLKP